MLDIFSFCPQILAGKLKPNLGIFSEPPDWTEILNYFRGSELQNYFTKILEDDLKAVMKPQYVDQIPRAVKGSVQFLLDKRDERKNQDDVCTDLDLMRVKSESQLVASVFCLRGWVGQETHRVGKIKDQDFRLRDGKDNRWKNSLLYLLCFICMYYKNT